MKKERIGNMLICEEGFECYNWRYADKLEDIEEDCKCCSKLLDVEVVKSAEWIKIPLKKYPDEYKFQCSRCKTISLAEHKYCPECGAKMKEVR